MSTLSELTEVLEHILENAERELAGVETLAELEELRRAYVGKKSQLGQILRKVGELPQEERPQLGKRVNEIKERLLALTSEDRYNRKATYKSRVFLLTEYYLLCFCNNKRIFARD